MRMRAFTIYTVKILQAPNEHLYLAKLQAQAG
jgi:hypothetical protein